MRVAALYDVHGMPDALDAVLADVERERVDLIVLGGDCVHGPQPVETLERLRALGDRALWLRGNTDRLVAEHAPGDETHGRVAAMIGADGVEFLRGLPFSHTLDLGRLGRVLFCHATPESDEAFLQPEDRFDDVDADVVVAGHTHVQEDIRLGRLRWVNAGSVGLPREELVSGWALLGRDVELRRTPYDVVRAVAALRSAGPATDHWVSGIERRARA